MNCNISLCHIATRNSSTIMDLSTSFNRLRRVPSSLTICSINTFAMMGRLMPCGNILMQISGQRVDRLYSGGKINILLCPINWYSVSSLVESVLDSGFAETTNRNLGLTQNFLRYGSKVWLNISAIFRAGLLTLHEYEDVRGEQGREHLDHIPNLSSTGR